MQGRGWTRQGDKLDKVLKAPPHPPPKGKWTTLGVEDVFRKDTNNFPEMG